VATPTPFTGFSRQGVEFLAELAANNDRAWFQPRKAEYERLLKEPLAALCLALGDRFEKAQLPLASDPVRSPFRIYRDVRFSADKSPYKTQVSASFPWTGEGGGVGGYFHLAPGEIFAGGGMWHPEPARLASWRRRIVDRWPEVQAVVADPRFVATFGEVSGDSLTRVPAGFPRDHPQARLLKLRDVTFGRRLSDEEVFSSRLPDLLVETYEAAVPLLALLAGLEPQGSRAAWLRS
jgi:uncharacterized protein (TIGR02453 family)